MYDIYKGKVEVSICGLAPCSDYNGVAQIALQFQLNRKPSLVTPVELFGLVRARQFADQASDFDGC